MIPRPVGWCIALGGGSALDTLGSQAFTGGSRSTDLSVHFQRCVVLLWILLIPVGVLWAFMEPVLLAIKEPPRLCKDVQDILRILLFGAPGYIAFESLKKYLQCQGIMKAATWVLIMISPINIALNIFLVHYTSLGMLGCPVALSITYWLHKQNATWGGFQPKAVFNIESCIGFLKLALPGILMVGTEWAAFEIVALAAGRLGELPLAAQSVIMTTDQSIDFPYTPHNVLTTSIVISTLPFGFGVVASNRIGNLIGARTAIGARNAAHAIAFISVIVGFIVMIIMLAARNKFGYIFSDDEDVVRLVSKVMPLVASFQVSTFHARYLQIREYLEIADGLANSCGGVLRGQGRQHLGAMFNLVAYYILALPIGITLAFKTGIGLQGLWIGQVIGLFTVGLSEYGMVWLGTNWDREIQKGIKRNAEEAKRRVLAEQIRQEDGLTN
ncbi:MOP flippase [Suillus subalutaceus]|uniref:MOP flippase n=1 Tax=Suillus subalutaceus TaxID=48586 RepID=UPI001B86F9DB|nr:MOP flippase [Suillus subalutaceus]KAG1857342.1 MOP flippase [Suillus subalutaceus]